MTILCIECEGPIERGEFHYVLPTRPKDLRPRRMHQACHELAHHIAASYHSGRAIESGKLRAEWARVRAREGKCRPEPYAVATSKAGAIASRLLDFKGPRAASDWA